MLNGHGSRGGDRLLATRPKVRVAARQLLLSFKKSLLGRPEG